MRTLRPASAVLALAALIALAGAPAGAQEVPRPEDRAYARALFVDVLDREPSDAEREGTAELLYLTPRSTVARDVVFGVENLEQEVTELYQEALGRPAEPSARHHWVEQLRRGTPLREVVARVAGSTEFFFRTAGGDLDQWYEEQYQLHLGRSIGAAERTYWQQQFSTRGPVGVVRAIYESRESRARRVAEVGLDVLGRAPAGPDLTFWVQRGLDDLVFAHRLTLTREYDDRAQARFAPD